MKTSKWMLAIGAGLIISFATSSCYNDKAQVLYLQNSCDSTSATYTATIAPLLEQYCNSCHGGSAAAGGDIPLNNYAQVKTYIDNGRLLGSITHAYGFSKMPQNGAQLDDCNLGKAKHWIADGAPNN